MGEVWLELALVVALILLNAAFAGSELALVSLRDSQIARLEQQGGAGALLARLARDPNRFLATIQVGITLAGFLASAAAAVSLSRPLVEPLSFLGSLAQPTAVVLVTLILSYFTLVLGELAPKRVALQRSEGWGLMVARPLAFLSTLARPVVWVLGVSTDVAVRLLGGDPSVQRQEITHEELRDIVSSRPGFHRIQREIMSGAFDIAERNVGEVLVPRRDVTWLASDCSVEEAIERLLASGHSRAPVQREDPDDVVGVVHLRDLIGKTGTVGEHARPAIAMPETLPVVQALTEMQRSRAHLAVVIDEHGGTEGIVTIEDLLEELVGEIYDEFDRDTSKVARHEDGSFTVSGTFPIHELPALGASLPEGHYTTVGGFVMDRMGRVPDKGETLEDSGWHVEVLDVSTRSVTRVRLKQVRSSGER